ncbi:MAG: portal protein [Cetobacterium sp.]|uniref:portal protein n=1 Tax=Cetobacterium sp. TaxID=2071632 RepID=UPI003EE67A34
MKIDMKTKFIQGKLPELKAHIDRLYNNAQYGREEKSIRFMKAYDYYLARLPKPLMPDSPTYVEPVVAKAVDKVLPSLLNIFTENEQQAVVFRPQSAMVPAPVADAVNKYINDCFLRDNQGYKLMNRAFREALITGDCFVKVYIEEKVYEEELELEDWTPTDALMPLLQEYPDTDIDTDDFEMKDQMLDEQQGIIIVVAKGKLVLKRIERKPRIDFIPFTEMYIDGMVEDIADAPYVCHRRTVTLGDMVEMGFDEETVMTANIASGAASTTPLSTSKLINMSVFVAEQQYRDIVTADEYQRNATLFEHYVRTSLLDKKRKTKLYQVFSTGTEILEINEIERMPFCHGIVEELPGSFWGISFYDKFKNAQDLMSEHHRSIISAAHYSTYPAFMAVAGNYNRQSLLNLRPGAVVEVDQPNAVTPFVPFQLNNMLMDSYAKVEASTADDMMNSVGMSFDGQNLGGVSATAVAAAVHSGEMKDKKLAKCLALSLIKPMYELIYNIMRDEDLEVMLEVPSEEGVQVQPLPSSQLPKRSEFFIDVTTVNDDASQMAQLANIMMSELQASQSPAPSQVITPMNRYKMYKEMLKRSNIHNVEDYLTDPTPPQPTEEEMMLQKQIEERTQQLQMEQLELGNETLKADLMLKAAQIANAEVQTDELIKDNAAQRMRDQEKSIIEFQKLELKKKEIEAEIELEDEQGRPVSIG